MACHSTVRPDSSARGRVLEGLFGLQVLVFPDGVGAGNAKRAHRAGNRETDFWLAPKTSDFGGPTSYATYGREYRQMMGLRAFPALTGPPVRFNSSPGPRIKKTRGCKERLRQYN